jgi:hypothetical protein
MAAYMPGGNPGYWSSMNTTRPKIRTVGDKWRRFLIVRESPEPDRQPEYWGGDTWVRDRRAAVLYAHQNFVREDLKKMQGKG